MFCHVNFGLIITGAELQLLLSVEDVIFLLLFVHLTDIDLHQLVSLHCLSEIKLALIFGRGLFLGRVQNLVIQLDLVLETLFATIKHLYSFLFGPVDRDFGLLRLKCPTLLVVDK